jgi:hypothetical protein
MKCVVWCESACSVFSSKSLQWGAVHCVDARFCILVANQRSTCWVLLSWSGVAYARVGLSDSISVIVRPPRAGAAAASP